MSDEPAITLLLRHAAQLVTLDGPEPDAARPHEHTPLRVVEDGAVAIAGDRIVRVGTTASVERGLALAPGATVLDVGDAVLAPGLLDVHTHALFAGDRADEFALRLEGAGYEQIAKQGGGIARSVRALRAASDETLTGELSARLGRMRACGVTSVEVKTGYGLDTASELRALALIRAVARESPTRVFATALPLHAVDPALRAMPDGRARFLSRTYDETVPVLLEARPDFLDAYVDSAGFSCDEVRPALARARAAGVPLRLHVGQLADVGGAALAAEWGACSADHLEHVSDEGARAMAQAGVVGVLLPGAAFSLAQPMPDARRLRALGMALAVATDCNPGTSYTEHLPLMVSFAVRQMGLSIVEGWWAVTRWAARSLRRDDLGVLRAGATADLCALALPSWQALPYRLGATTARFTVHGGRVQQHATNG